MPAGKKKVQSNSKLNIRSIVLLVIVVAILYFVLIFANKYYNPVRVPEETRIEFSIQSTQEVIERTQVSWTSAKSAKGIMLLFHGCNHDAEDWFYLPEEKTFILNALEQNFHLIAISSAERIGPRCWNINFLHTDEDLKWHPDLSQVLKVTELLIEREKWHNLPVVAVGASSGGYFASMLPFYWNQQATNPIKAIISIIAPTHPISISRIKSGSPFPAIGFIEMSKDMYTEETIFNDAKLLHSQKIEHEIWKVAPVPLSLTFFYEKLNITLFQSAEMYNTLHKDKYLTSQDYLVADPRRSGWKASLTRQTNLKDLVETRYFEIEELMNVAWGSHEMTSAFCEDAIGWASLFI